ncbi:Lrp/AsnC family transcriptional regulator [Candidatus Woesearchaeota archaeon]|nr:Lrp/AsnC family transcriptional regulator [Candidatus Woesearchaeota archaeon]
MKEKDLKIISHLRRDARMPLTKMSKSSGIPVSTIFDRLKVNAEDFIVKHTCLLDFSKMGYHTRANIVFKVSNEDKESFRSFMIKHSSINSLYKINNGFDFMAEGVFKHIKDMEEFIELVESEFRVEDKKYYYIVDDLKREGFLTKEEPSFF